MKRLKRLSAGFIMLVLLTALLCTSAYGEGQSQTVTLKKGDTLCSVCQDLGLNYVRCKGTIMELNGFTAEWQLYKVQAGTTLKFPCAKVTGTGANVSEDTVAYYLMPYMFKDGDSLYSIYHLWGLNYETFAEDIRVLNEIEDLNLIGIGRLMYLPTNKDNLMGEDYTKVMAHTLKSGDSAYDICKSYGMDYDDVADSLQRFNQDQDVTTLAVGDTMYIPVMWK